jgi:hypothetical protein
MKVWEMIILHSQPKGEEEEPNKQTQNEEQHQFNFYWLRRTLFYSLLLNDSEVPD